MKSKAQWLFAAAIAAACVARGAAADFYVRPPGTTSTDASPYDTWENAATQIQWAVNVAMTNLPATVWVTNGQYCVTNQVAITNSITVRSVSGWANTLVYSAWPAYTTRCFYVVKTGVVDGFTISNGHDNTAGGGGVYIDTFGQVQNCYILHNVCSNRSATIGGAGVYVRGNGILSNCVVFSNTMMGGTTSRGGGINAEASKVLNCRIISNTIEYGYGGGIRTYGIVSNCFIAFNTAALHGGGLYGAIGGFFTDCVISNNSSASSGGGVRFDRGTLRNSVIVNNISLSSDPATGGGGGISFACGTVSNCVVAFNLSRCSGGGVYLADELVSFFGVGVMAECRISNNIVILGPGGGGVTVTNGGKVLNCLIHHNTNTAARGNGGGVFLGGAAPTYRYPNRVTFANCTVSGNYSTNEGGGMAAVGMSNYIVNCVIAGNSSFSNNYPDVFNAGDNANNYTNCCSSADLPPGQGNIAADPLLDAACRLGNGSPCINAGMNQGWMTNAFDLDGRARIRYGTVDMGAYEKIHNATIYNFH